MRAIAIRCPECGAQLTARAEAATVTCEYCGNTAAIQRRGPAKGPAVPAPEPGAPAWLSVAVVAGILTASGALAAFMILRERSGGESSARVVVSKSSASSGAPRWDGAPYGAVLRDLTGDGVADVIGRVQTREREARIAVAAFDGATGERLWMSEPIGLRSDVHLAPLGVSDEVVLIGDGTAGVTAFAIADGSTRWTIRLHEKIEGFCAADEGQVSVLTADGARHPVALASGAPAPAGDDRACVPLPSDRDPAPAAISYSRDHRGLLLDDAAPGLRANEALHHAQSGVTIALGHKTPGTRVPTVASYRWPEGWVEAVSTDSRAARRRARPEPEVLWTAAVPGGDPLLAKEGAPRRDHVAVGGGAVVVAYELRERRAIRVTALSVTDGRRLWDRDVPGTMPLSAVAASDTHAFVSRWDGLSAFALDSGAHVYTIP
jgi:hypothetical protein